MKRGSYLWTTLAVAVLVAGPAAARHRGHHAYSHHGYKHVSHQLSDVDPQHVDKTEFTVDHDKQETRPGKDGKGGDDHEWRDERKVGKNGVSTQGHDVDSKGDASNSQVDTRITVHQGREIVRGGKKPRLKDHDGIAGVAGVKHEHPHDRHRREAKDHPAEKQTRNASGAKIDSDKPQGEHRNAIGLPTTTNSSFDPKTNTTSPVGSNGGANGAIPSSPSTQQVSNQTAVNGPNGAGKPPAGPNRFAVTPGNSALWGTGMVKPVVRTGMVSGTPKPGAAAIISGNNVYLRHP